MPDKTLPYVIDAKDARVGDVLELSGYSDDPTQRIIGRAREYGGSLLRVGGWWIDEAPKVTLLDRPAPPKPALPTEPLTAIRCTIDAEATAVLTLGGTGWWTGGDRTESRAIGPHALKRITDWTVVYDPSAPKSEDGMREQVEKLAESIKGPALLYRTVSAPEVYSSLQRILNETSAS